MAVNEETSTLPWDREPPEPGDLEAGSGCVSELLSLLACAAGFFAIFCLMAALVFGLLMGQGAAVGAVIGIFGLVLLALSAGLFKRYSAVFERSRIASERRNPQETDVLFVRKGFSCWMDGSGTFSFQDASAELTGRFVPATGNPVLRAFVPIMLGMPFMLAAQALGFRGMAVAYCLVPLLGLPLFAFPVSVWFIWYLHRARPDTDDPVSFTIARDNLKSVRCKGPIVTICFHDPPAEKLRAVRLYVAPHYREQFFPEFERVFPGLLPEEYRAVVASLSLSRRDAGT